MLPAVGSGQSGRRSICSARVIYARKLARGSLTKATVGFHVARLGAQQSTGSLGRRAVTELLARAGVRASELCDLRWRDVRLHEPSGARFYVRSSKTDAGVREVQMTPDLLQAVIEHRDRLRRAGQPAGQDDFVIPNRRGGRLDRQRVPRPSSPEAGRLQPVDVRRERTASAPGRVSLAI